MAKRILVYLFLLIPLIGFFSSKVFAYTSEDCIDCHKQGSKKSSLQISVEDYQNSVHGRASMSCSDCHVEVKDDTHIKQKGPVPVFCGECHDEENRHGLSGEGYRRPMCYSCHTTHHILGKGVIASSIYPKALKKTCAACHPAECGREDYLSWFPSLQVVSHGKEDFSKNYGRGNCLGCHQGAGAHGEKKVINHQNCYKCHDSLKGYMHPKADPSKEPTVFAAALIYQFFGAALLVGGFCFYTQKTIAKKRKPRK
jgi:hypothetical protein